MHKLEKITNVQHNEFPQTEHIWVTDIQFKTQNIIRTAGKKPSGHFSFILSYNTMHSFFKNLYKYNIQYELGVWFLFQDYVF